MQKYQLHKLRAKLRKLCAKLHKLHAKLRKLCAKLRKLRILCAQVLDKVMVMATEYTRLLNLQLGVLDNL